MYLPCSGLPELAGTPAFLLLLASATSAGELRAFPMGLYVLVRCRLFSAISESPVNGWAPFEIPPLPQLPGLRPVLVLVCFLALTIHFDCVQGVVRFLLRSRGKGGLPLGFVLASPSSLPL